MLGRGGEGRGGEGRGGEGRGGEGSGPLQFSSPLGVGINKANNKIYIADYGNCRIQILNMDLTFSSSFGTRGSGDGQFNYPLDVAFDSTGNLYVADEGNHRIQVFTPEGKFLCKFGSLGRGDGQLSYPWSITIDRNDTVYVAEYGNNRISMFTTHVNQSLLIITNMQ